MACFERVDGNKRLMCAVNRSERTVCLSLPIRWHGFTVNLGGGIPDVDGNLTLPPFECAIFVDNDEY